MLWKYETQSNGRQHVMPYRGSGRGGKINWSSRLLLSTALAHLEYFSLIDRFTIKPPSPVRYIPVCSMQLWAGARDLLSPDARRAIGLCLD